MKRITASLVLIALLGNASCKKEEKKTSPDPGPPPPPAARTWTIDATTYSVATANASDTTVAFGDNNTVNTLSFFFKTKPKASGVYNVVRKSPGANEVVIYVANSVPYMVGSPEAGTVNATVANGKITLKCTGIQFYKINSSLDTLGIGSLSADLYY